MKKEEEEEGKQRPQFVPEDILRKIARRFSSLECGGKKNSFVFLSLSFVTPSSCGSTAMMKIKKGRKKEKKKKKANNNDDYYKY